MSERLHPSLRTYVDCFLSPPFPKGFPRGGGVYDQDPILMRDFRTIQKFEQDWKAAQRQSDEAKQNLGQSLHGQQPTPSVSGGGGLNLEDLMNELGEDF